MKINLSVCLISCLVILVAQGIRAQSFWKYNVNQYGVSLSLGTATYFGDLKEGRDLDLNLSVGLGFTYKLTSRFVLRSELIWYRISGSDEEAFDQSRRNRNLSFRADNFELSVQGVILLFEERHGLIKRAPDLRPYNFYGFLGIGVTTVNPRAELNGVWHNLRGLETEGVEYGAVSLVIPGGIGAKYKPNVDWNFALEMSYHLVFSDYYDDVSTVYPDPSIFTDPVAAALSDRSPELGLPSRDAGTQRGNPSSDDGYLIINIRVEYLGLAKLFSGSTNRSRFKKPRRYKARRYKGGRRR